MRRTAFLGGTVFGCALAVGIFARANLGGSDGIAIPYRGYLELGGNPVSEVMTLGFDIYNVASGGTPCSQQVVNNVPVYSGEFQVVFTVSPESCIIDRPVFVEVRVNAGLGNEVTLTGRQRIYPAMGALAAGPGDFVIPGQVQGNLTVQGRLAAPRVDIANRWRLEDTGDDWLRVHGMNGTTYHGGVAAGRLYSNGDTVVNGNLSVAGMVTGRLLTTEYQTVCPSGLSGSSYAYCCRIQTSTGVTTCAVANSTNFSNAWTPTPSPFPTAGSSGPYSLTCNGWQSGANFPLCCRTDGFGNVGCVYNTTNHVNGPWAGVGANPL